jgi:hypothetical protein
LAARLNVLNGKRQGATFELGRGEHIVGHRQTAHLSIDDPWVSWDHARIFIQGDTYWIEDLGSTNGTYVNCVRVKRERLNHEDIIFFGKTHVIFLAQEGASTRPSSVDGSGRHAGSGLVSASALAALGKPSQSSGPAIPVPLSDVAPIGMPPARPPSRTGVAEPAAPTWRGPGARPPAASDPFASAARSSGGAVVDPLLAGANDPFTISSTDGEPPAEEGGPRSSRSFADTHHDEEGGPRPAASRGPDLVDLDDFAIDEDDDDGGGPSNIDKAPSAAEVSRLLGNRTTDDLDALLGEAAAMTPDPSVARVPQRSQLSEARTQSNMPAFNPPAQSPSGLGRRADPTAITGRMPAEKSGLPSPQATPVPPSPPTAPGTARFGTAPPPPARPMTVKIQPSATGPVARPDVHKPDTVLDGDSDAPRVGDAAHAAFERARLEDEVRRLRAALKAASERSPDAVRIAAETLRDQELGRLARRVAELEQEVAQKRAEVQDKQRELDVVTEDMIAKEDTIDALREKLRAAGIPDPTGGESGKRRSPRLPASPPPLKDESSDELRLLEF